MNVGVRGEEGRFDNRKSIRKQGYIDFSASKSLSGRQASPVALQATGWSLKGPDVFYESNRSANSERAAEEGKLEMPPSIVSNIVISA